MFVDTHTHLYLPEFGENLDERKSVVGRAFDAGVDKLIFPNVDADTVAPMIELAEAFPDRIFTAMGLHPTEVKDDWREKLEYILGQFDGKHKHIAVGEIGIDLYWDKTFVDQQMQVLDLQAQKAAELNLPLIIHCRDGLEQTLEVLEGNKSVEAVFHSFGGTPDDVKRIRRVGDYYFGINGVVTFKNSNLAPAVNEITIDRILLETDSPYLTPVPFRGKRNESSYIAHIAAKIAEILSIGIEDVGRFTTLNTENLFGIKSYYSLNN